MIIVLVTSKLFNFYNFSGLDGTTSLSAFSSWSDTGAYHFVSPLEAVSIDISPLSSTTTEYDFKSVTQLVSGEALALRISKIPWCHGQIRL